MAEFALVAPMFFILLFAIIEAGRFIYHSEILNNAAREGARYAIIHGSNAADGCPSGPPAPGSTPCDVPGDNVRQAIVDAAFGFSDAGLVFGWPSDSRFPLYLSSDGSTELSTNARGTNVAVRIQYTYSPLMPVLPSITIRTESTLVINN
jgi:hypothetical protein